MPMSQTERALAFFFRVAMGWVFLYAAYQQISDPYWTAATFLNQTKTAHDLFAWVASPTKVTVADFLVKWGHLLIGLSLVLGLLTRAGAFFGAILMSTYYLAHMDFPYVENQSNFLVDYHLIYVGVLVQLVVARAGQVIGLDRWASRTPVVRGMTFCGRSSAIRSRPGVGSGPLHCHGAPAPAALSSLPMAAVRCPG
jgi:thiosulfate dehydrogenase [quinone] large subunit